MRKPEELIDASFLDPNLKNQADEETLQLIYQGIKLRKEKSGLIALGWRRLAVAATIALITGAGGYLLFFHQHQEQEKLAQVEKTDVAPPSSVHAFITLSNGQQITLDNVKNRSLAQQGGTQILQLAEGEIVYQDKKNNGAGILFNQLTNPRGSRIVHLVLSDGTKVWLNSESSLRYPVAFTSNERKVEITGEGYFEVAHRTQNPFHVFLIRQNDTLDVKVLGTHFNVNAFKDLEMSKITLLEGSISIQSSFYSSGWQLKRGEQAQFPASLKQPMQIISNADLKKTMAWKNNEFIFEDDEMTAIMPEVARWYDVRFFITGQSAAKYTGQISRDVPMSQVLKMFEQVGYARFEIKGSEVKVEIK